MKKCSKCQKEKELSQFSLSTAKGHQSWCKDCASFYRMKKYYDDPKAHRTYQKERVAKLKVVASSMKTKCLYCDEKDPICLDFHHLDPDAKSFNISDIRHGLKKMIEEIDKCVVVCANCHRKLHSGQRLVPETASEVTGITNQNG